MISTDPIALATRGVEAFNAADWDTLRELCHGDVVYTESGTNRRLEGIDACLAAWREWRGAMSGVTGTVGRTLADGRTVALEVVWRGVHDGPLMTPTGPIPATGAPVSIVATQWQAHRDDRIAAIDHHLDILSLLAQIGALPA